ncbi:unnamed protein product [Sphagnum jensenii]|uniref:Uncharacterized protein n=1 Tax=Sphagnum jensenii TaxID=128206 RepID=A0ABP0V687_9BRYO
MLLVASAPSWDMEEIKDGKLYKSTSVNQSKCTVVLDKYIDYDIDFSNQIRERLELEKTNTLDIRVSTRLENVSNISTSDIWLYLNRKNSRIKALPEKQVSGGRVDFTLVIESKDGLSSAVLFPVEFKWACYKEESKDGEFCKAFSRGFNSFSPT